MPAKDLCGVRIKDVDLQGKIMISTGNSSVVSDKIVGGGREGLGEETYVTLLSPLT